MSVKGGRDRVKDGGAHGAPHETLASRAFLVTGSLFENGISHTSSQIHIEAPARSIQNGGQSEHIECADGDLQLLPDCESSLDTFGYDRAISANNVGWLKSRCKNVDAVQFDCETKENEQCDSDGELFSEHMPGVEERGGVGLCSDTTRPTSQGKNVTETVGTIVVESLVKLDNSSGVASEDLSNQGVTVHFGEFPNGDSDTKNGNPEVFPLQLIQSFSDKSDAVSLMTPQELESLPNRGLEFEDTYSSQNYNSSHTVTNNSCKIVNNSFTSVQYSNKHGQIPRSLSKEEASSLSSDDRTDDEQSEHDGEIDEQSLLLNTATNSTERVLGRSISCSSPASSDDSSDMSPQSREPVSDSQTEATNLTLATISISTDKTANSTQILVNTNQGQQLYLINTADLTQATNALQPLAHPTVSNKTSVTELPLPSAASAPPSADARTSTETVDHHPEVQPLQIQSTGYLIVPVAQQEGSNGLMVTSPLTAVPSEYACQSRRVWVCPESGCDKVFRKLSKLKIHQMRHTGERPFKCSRSGCDWAFTTAYKLKRHEESHEGRKDYNCDFHGCGRKFTTVYNLNSHRKLHERPCTETCPEAGCGQCFPTKRQLDLHVRTHTGMEKTYKCPVSGCDKVFFSPNCMGSHTRVHLQDRQDLTCRFEGCGKVFDKQCRLKQHERRHTGEKPYVCHFQGCNWAFTTASKLKRHKAKHTGVRKWVCSVCNKGFMRAEHLKGHLVTHSGVKPFVCPVEGCKARFTAKSSLYVHLKKHDASGKQITYHCPMEGCVRNYSSKAGLRNHILKHCLSTPQGSDPASALDWVPLLGGDDDNLDSLVHSSPESTSLNASNSTTGTLPVTALSSPQDRSLTTDFVSPVLSEGDCLSAEQLSSNIVSQLIANTPLQPAQPEGGAAPASKPSPKIAIATDAASLSTVALENSSGSARTDYRSNHMLSERARRRWHSVKNGGSLKVDESIVCDTIFPDNTEKTRVSDPVSPLFPSPDILSSSQGVMFRDPETGITYVQTQLLQDDPPHPALYDDESSDASVTGAVSFTGTTINMQDLK
ncbi:zinc finger protein ZXDC-like isoform X1 [Haliotis cracherodii]|uniref:zinc finger protein ZXDC-like isoform X1 n=1 Tax=Haliotis cracherodii TaxID=6455 RepID=UPI0039E9C0D6